MLCIVDALPHTPARHTASQRPPAAAAAVSFLSPRIAIFQSIWISNPECRMKISRKIAADFCRIAANVVFLNIVNSGVTGQNFTKFCTMQKNSYHLIICNRNFDIAIHLGMTARQQRLVRDKRQFCDFNWLPWQRPLRDRKVVYQVNKPFHLSTNPEILVKIGLSDSEIVGLESRLLKIFFKNIGKMYSPVGKFAERAKTYKRTYFQVHTNF